MPADPRQLTARRHGLLLGAIVLGALVLRLASLDRAPPGLFFDEAANAIDAVDLLAEGRPRLFFPGNQGREPLHIYAIAATTWLFGPGWLAVRLPSVLVGLATVFATYLLGREVGGLRVGLLGALLLAVSYWHVWLSRLGFRAVWVPLLVGLALALLLRAERTRRLWPAAVAGGALGLGLYTYIAARLLPVVVLAVGGLSVWRRPSREALARLVLPLVIAATVAFPIAWYFARHPEHFWMRLESASGGPLSVGQKVGNALGLFLWQGDPLARHNFPERAVFDPIAGALFLIGLGVCVRRRNELRYMALPFVCTVMLLPQVLAWGEPHFLRSVGVLPASQVTAALGFDAVLSRLRPMVAGALVGVLVFYWATAVAWDYFFVWAPSHAAYDASDGDGRAAAELLRGLPGDRPVAAGSRIYADRATFYLGAQRQPDTVFDSLHAVVLPAGGTTVVLPRPSDVPREVLTRLGEPALEGTGWRDPGGYPPVVLYRASPSAFTPTHALPADAGGVSRIHGYDLRPVVAPGDLQRVIVSWEALGPARAGLYQFAHVVARARGGEERVWAIDDVAPVPSRGWRGGERALTWFDLRLPNETPIGALWVATGFYETPSLRRLPLTDLRGAPLGDRILAGPFKVWHPHLAQPAPAQAVAEFAGGLRIAFAQLPTEAVRGQPTLLRVGWWAAAPTPNRLTVFAHLLEAGQHERAGADGPPAGGTNPTDLWQPGEVVVDERTFTLPADAPAGRYAVEYGLYDPSTGLRLPLVSAGERMGDAAILGWIELR